MNAELLEALKKMVAIYERMAQDQNDFITTSDANDYDTALKAIAKAKAIEAGPYLLEAALQIQSEIDTVGLLEKSYEKLLNAIKKATD
jgi:hypothetical protein